VGAQVATCNVAEFWLLLLLPYLPYPPLLLLFLVVVVSFSFPSSIYLPWLFSFWAKQGY